MFFLAYLKLNGDNNGDSESRSDQDKINLLKWLSINLAVSTICLACVICLTKSISIKFSAVLGVSIMLPNTIFAMIAFMTDYVIQAGDYSSSRVIIELRGLSF